jgi:hypothetical protein
VTSRGIWKPQAALESDDVIHLAYISELIHHFPPENPGFSGIPLKGYHFFSDFVIATIHQITTIPIHLLYFQFFPFLVGVMWALGAFILGHLRAGIRAGWITVFLVLFGGSAVFLFHLSGFTDISLNSGFGIDQPVTALMNLPYATSFIFIFLFLISAYHYFKTNYPGFLLILSLTAGLLPLFKIYGGILVYVGIIWIGLYTLCLKRWKQTLLLCTSLLLTAITFFIFAGSGNRLFFHPLWAPHTILESNLPWYGFHEKMYTYTQQSVIKGLVTIELHGLSLFLLGNLGTRSIGIGLYIYYLIRRKIRFELFDGMLFLMMLVSIILPLFFIQSGKVFEIIQFGWHYPIFGALFAAHGFEQFLKKKLPFIIRLLLITIVIVATLPSSLESMTRLISRSPFVQGTNRLLATPQFIFYEKLKQLGNYDDTVLELPPLDYPPDTEKLKQWFRATVPYLPYFANKRSYFTSQNIEFANLNLEDRASLIQQFLQLEQSDLSQAQTANNLQNLTFRLSQEKIRSIISTEPLKLVTRSADIKEVLLEPPYRLYHLSPANSEGNKD